MGVAYKNEQKIVMYIDFLCFKGADFKSAVFFDLSEPEFQNMVIFWPQFQNFINLEMKFTNDVTTLWII